MTQITRWQLSVVDTWFFREARAHDAVGVSELSSVFPPPVTTLMGAVRTFVGDQMGVNWAEFARGAGNPAWRELLGDGQNLGTLTLHQMQLSMGTDKPIYPAPVSLLMAEQPNTDGSGSDTFVTRLQIGAPVESDLGYVALPQAAPGTPPGSKPLTEAWLTKQGLEDWLAGKTPEAATIIRRNQLFTEEARLGIGRNNKQATVEKGLLYQTRHLRPRADVDLGVELYIAGVPEDLTQQLDRLGSHTLRLGGEGRPARLEISAVEVALPKAPTPDQRTKGLILLLQSPADFGTDSNAELTPLPGFQPVLDDQGRVLHWQGELHGVGLKLVSACMDRMLRQGGWDQQRRQPKPIRSLVKPGSVFYCELLNETQTVSSAIQSLHGSQIGQGREWGLGRLLAGLWQADEHV